MLFSASSEWGSFSVGLWVLSPHLVIQYTIEETLEFNFFFCLSALQDLHNWLLMQNFSIILCDFSMLCEMS